MRTAFTQCGPRCAVPVRRRRGWGGRPIAVSVDSERHELLLGLAPWEVRPSSAKETDPFGPAGRITTGQKHKNPSSDAFAAGDLRLGGGLFRLEHQSMPNPHTVAALAKMYDLVGVLAA